MNSTGHRTLRPLSAAPAPGEASRRGGSLPLRLLQAFILVGGMAALGWRAQHPDGEVRLQVELAAPSAATAGHLVRPTHRAAPAATTMAHHPPHHAGSAVRTARRAPHSASATGHAASWSPPRHVARPRATARPATAVPVVRALPAARAVTQVVPRSGKVSTLLPPISTAGDAARRALAPNPGARIMALPSVSVGVIRAELRRWHSPLLQAHWADGKDAAQYIWDAGRVLHMDPAVVMAFFWHESHYGTRGMARLTDSVGNIRPLDGQPELNGYRFYRSWEEGVDDTYRLLRRYARTGAGDVATAVPVWAPSTDNNDVAAYVNDVQATMARYFVTSTSTQMARSGGAELVAAVR